MAAPKKTNRPKHTFGITLQRPFPLHGRQWKCARHRFIRIHSRAVHYTQGRANLYHVVLKLFLNVYHQPNTATKRMKWSKRATYEHYVTNATVYKLVQWIINSQILNSMPLWSRRTGALLLLEFLYSTLLEIGWIFFTAKQFITKWDSLKIPFCIVTRQRN